MVEKDKTPRSGNTEENSIAGQVESSTHIPDSIRRAIKAHAREWQAAQKREAELDQELGAESEENRSRRAASLAQAGGLEAEMRRIALRRAERRGRSAGSQPKTEESEP